MSALETKSHHRESGDVAKTLFLHYRSVKLLDYLTRLPGFLVARVLSISTLPWSIHSSQILCTTSVWVQWVPLKAASFLSNHKDHIKDDRANGHPDTTDFAKPARNPIRNRRGIDLQCARFLFCVNSVYATTGVCQGCMTLNKCVSLQRVKDNLPV